MTTDGVFLVDPAIRCRDVIVLNIPNDNLKRRVETFLDVLEKSAFRYDFMDQESGQVEARYFSGQDMLKRITDVRTQIGSWLQEHQGSKIAEYFANTSVGKSGKFAITQHNPPI